MTDSGGVSRDYDRSFSQKLAFILIHACIVVTCIWLAFGRLISRTRRAHAFSRSALSYIGHDTA